ncbi:MAG: NADP-dependent oxidoreductase [Janthinobacterium lividum]
MTMMKAIVVHQYGGPDVLMYEDVPIPTPGEGDVLLKVEAAGVNPGETKIRQGAFAEYHTLPFILGFDLAGTVAALGPGVTQIAVGDAVYTNSDSTRNGGYAEFVAVRAAGVALRPKTLDAVHAASVPLAGLTAWQALSKEGGLTAGQTILIHGAGGAVGSFAVQFAKVKGASVIATATGEDLDYVRSLGADVVIDYKTEKFEDVAKDVNVVLNTIAGETQARSWQTLRSGGILVATPGPPDQDAARAHGVLGKMVEVAPSAADLTEIAALIDAGQVKTRVGLTFPLSEARQAHERLEQGGTHGKIVLIVA